MSDARIPVYLVTGLPGCGKTRMLNKLIETLHPGTMPITIVHRFAREFGLDVHPVAERAFAHGLYGEMHDFGSGCVCCSPTGEMLQHLLAARDQVQGPCAVVVETTGLARPSLFLQLIRANPEVAASFRVQCVVCVVHKAMFTALEGHCDCAAKTLAQEQLSAADVVALEGAGLDASDAGVASKLCVAAPACDWSLLDSVTHAGAAGEEGATCSALALPVGLDGHDSSYTTFCLMEDAALQAARIAAWAESIVRESTHHVILRVKGVVSIAHGDRDCGHVVVEWSLGQDAVSLSPIEPVVREGQPHGTLGHSLRAGLDVPKGTSKVFVCGEGISVNAMRRHLWDAMVPEGFRLAADVELDFPEAYRLTRSGASEDGGEPEGDVARVAPFEVRRLAGWRSDGRDVLLCSVGGVFCALADFAPGQAGRWALEDGAAHRIRGRGDDEAVQFVLISADGSNAVDLKTGEGVTLPGTADLPAGDGDPATVGPGPSAERVEMHILGGSIYVEHGPP